MIVLQFILLIVGFVLLMKGADWFVDAASKLADRFGIPHLVIGLTIVAFGTSAPEAAVSISAILSGSGDLSVGNVLGSNIMNVLLVLGLSAVIYPLTVKKTTIRFDIPFVFVISGLLLLLGMFDGSIDRLDGFLLVALLAVYMIRTIKLTKSGQIQGEEIEAASENDKLWKLILLTIIGIIMIVGGSNVTVDAASNIASAFGMSERLIGLTIVAFGTSLPELMTSCMAAKRKETDIAVGNIVGSNLFNVLFVLGVSAVIKPIAYTAEFIVDNIIATGVMVILWLFVARKQKLSRVCGIIMLMLYAVYFIELLI